MSVFINAIVFSEMLFSCFLYSSGVNQDLHSFPTRRSSDLWDYRRGLPENQRKFDSWLEANAVLGFILFLDRKSTRLKSSHVEISYAVFCLKKKNCSGTIHCAIQRLSL